MLKNRIE